MSYANPSHKPTIPLQRFTVNTPQSELRDLNLRLESTRLPTEIFDNTQTEENFGVTRKWMSDARNAWIQEFDWRKQEKRINAIPAFLAKVKNESGKEFTIHFAALFSTRADAIPIILSHGWPGCFLEFLPLLEMVKERYSPQNLPYHLIVPSLPGFAYSSKPGPTNDFHAGKVAYLFNELMLGLVVHVNFKVIQSPPEGTPEHKVMKGPPSPEESLGKMQQFAYALEHATRPSTIGMVVGCNPLSLLAWIGEKYMEWSDITLSLETILTFTTLYWLTDTYPSSIYTYRWSMGVRAFQQPKPKQPRYLSKPLGYSQFPKELFQVPAHWVATTGNLVWSRDHEGERGGHFAALEVPEVLWADVEEFLGMAWGMKEKERPKEQAVPDSSE